MRSYRKFFISIAVLLIFFPLINLLVWKRFTENLLTNKNYQGGDLARMGYIYGSKVFRKSSCDLPVRHLELADYTNQAIHVLTIGDSFSNGGGAGRNSYYQDYIASINNCNVLNLVPYQAIDNISALSMYANNGYLENIKPKYVILEASEKLCIDLAHTVEFDAMTPLAELAKQKKVDNRKKLPEVSFINGGNFKFLLYSLLYNFSDHAFMSKVYMMDLRIPLFSVTNASKLLFLQDDIRKIPRADAKSVGLLNNNLNTLADKLSAKGIKLYFMPCVDKYNLYREYIVKNRYPSSTFFEQLRKLPKRYTLIDTKAILAEELKMGEKDVFYADDTHWSCKGSEAIFCELLFK